MWFEALTGFREENPDQVRSNLTIRGDRMVSAANQRSMVWGRLEVPTLGELRERARAAGLRAGRIRVAEVTGDVQDLHRDPANSGALFQVASQFNLLEMVSPSVTPEQGVDRYADDHTQGPACAIAAGAGTIYRNYFVNVGGRIGQSRDHQIDCLADVGAALGNSDGRLWQMRNGYALATEDGLREIDRRLSRMGDGERDALRQVLRIGLQCDTEVTLAGAGHLVSQAYCSALPVAYSAHGPDLWASFATLVLEAAYEATLCAGVVNAARSGNPRVFLTLLGGGAFGNNDDWILGAVERALRAFIDAPLDVALVSYRQSHPGVRAIVQRMSPGR